MNYYDEEISIGGPDTKHLSSIKVDKLPSASRGSARLGSARGEGAAAALRVSANRSRVAQGGRQLKMQSSTDDDGLLQDILDHDDDDDDDEDDSDALNTPGLAKPNPAMRTQARPGSKHTLLMPTQQRTKTLDEDTDEPSETESDEVIGKPHAATGSNSGRSAATNEFQLSITSDKWERLSVHQDVKELFPYILKYTPQSIETHYHLQPFIPEYVPAVGDVDAFLKVTIPSLLQPQRQQEVNEHLRRMGLHFLDEPSGQQSEPSLLNMKLRSVLTGSGVNPRSTSAHQVPIAKSSKDIDKWIAEVEQVHMTQSVFDAQPRKDIEPLLIDWPRSYAEARGELLDAYQRSLQETLTLTQYIDLLCQKFEVEGTCETQTDFILNVQTLFALYLAANQAWE